MRSRTLQKDVALVVIGSSRTRANDKAGLVIMSGGKEDRASASVIAGIDCRLDARGIVMDAVSHCHVVANDVISSRALRSHCQQQGNEDCFSRMWNAVI